MNTQSLAYNSFSNGIQKINRKSVKAILETVKSGIFPGSQLYLYFRMHTPWEEALDPSEFIFDTAFIHKYQLPQEEKTEEMLFKYFDNQDHIQNIFKILTKARAS